MAVFKCKICGGALDIQEGSTVAVCEYCGTKQTLPRLDSEKKINLYDRANHFRRNNDYDKAMAIYENILNDDTTDAEAYWSILLCRYGVEYVEDAANHSHVPTINRAQFSSVLADEDYKSAIRYADAEQREIYEKEARYIDDVQKGILEISQKEEPFDVFICYKETDNNGRRTQDSVLATELYHGLSSEGFHVFFSRITLEDKLGTAYEPYIFAALNSAKVMVVLGTKPENFNSVWVKNEWSRYLALVKKSGGKKVLIPAFKDMDPYDLPEEFSHLQAQDMSKLGFMQDLIRGVKKIIGADVRAEPAKETVVVNAGNSNIAALLKRAFMFLEDGEWDKADDYCEQVLNQDPECADAYLGKLLAREHCKNLDHLVKYRISLSEQATPKKVVAFAYNDEVVRSAVKKYSISTYLTEEQIHEIYSFDNTYDSEKTEREHQLQEETDWWNNDSFYLRASRYASSALAGQLNSAKTAVQQRLNERVLQAGANDSASREHVVSNYRKHLNLAEETVARLNLAAIERKNLDIEKRKVKKKKRKHALAILSALSLIAIAIVVVIKLIIPYSKYKSAEEMLDARDYDNAIQAFEMLGGFSDSLEYISEAKYAKAVDLADNGYYKEAITIFASLGSYSDSRVQLAAVYSNITDRDTISAGMSHVIGLRSDGTVIATGSNKWTQCNVEDWSDIVAVSAGAEHTVGLRIDGTVIATGRNDHGQCNVGDWTDIVSISAGSNNTLGLRSDGTVVSTGDNEYRKNNVEDWINIATISAGEKHTVGLCSDGTVLSTGLNDQGACNTENWLNMDEVVAGYFYTVGLHEDGTVSAIGSTSNNKCSVDDWTNVTAIDPGYKHTVGLCSNGAVISVGDNTYGQCNVANWSDIAAISAGRNFTVGLCSDGTVVATGDNRDGQCDVTAWTGIKLPRSSQK